VTKLSQAGVDHLKNMKRLHTLDIFDDDYTKSRNLDFIIMVAGEVPSLRKFGFGAHGSSDNQFIEEFAEKYIQKELVVNRFQYVSL
jgi:hypothetical protein